MIDTYFNEDGDLDYYLKEIGKFPILTPEEEKKLGVRIQKGDKKALKHLVESNLRFVVHYARKFKHPSVSIMDLINEGNIGLIHAAERFDPSKDNRFITYAVWWIRQAILHAISQSSGLAIPQKRVQQIYQMGKVEQSLRRELERTPDPDEIAEEMGLSAEEVKMMQYIKGDFVSLNVPVMHEESLELHEALPEKKEPSPEYFLLEEAFEKEVQELLDQLQPREKEVLEMRFGLNHNEPHTLKEIGDTMGMSRERVRQLEQRALRKIRSKQKARKLLGYLN